MNLKHEDKIYIGQQEAVFHSMVTDTDAAVLITHTAYMATGEFGEYEEVEEFDKLAIVPLTDISSTPLYDSDILSKRNFEIEKGKTEARRIINEAKKEISTELTKHKEELKKLQEKISNIKIYFDGMVEAKEIMENEYFLTAYGNNNDYYTLIEKEKVLNSDDWSVKISINGTDNELTFYPVSYDEDYMYMSSYGRKGLMFKNKEDIADFLNNNLQQTHKYPLDKIKEFEELGISKDIFRDRKKKLQKIIDMRHKRNSIDNDIRRMEKN